MRNARGSFLPKRRLTFALLAALALAATGALAAPAEAAFPGANGKVAFTTDRTGNNEILTRLTTGTGQTDITNNGASDTGPSWSPDGTQIAFASDRSGNGDIYKMNADGSGTPHQLTTGLEVEISPAWSPDGTHLADVFTNDLQNPTDNQ